MSRVQSVTVVQLFPLGGSRMVISDCLSRVVKMNQSQHMYTGKIKIKAKSLREK